jgi:hypothetical protein
VIVKVGSSLIFFEKIDRFKKALRIVENFLFLKIPGSKIKSSSLRFFTIASTVCDAAILVSQLEFVTSVFNFEFLKINFQFELFYRKQQNLPFLIDDQARWDEF